MNILGISAFYHDAAAALIQQGSIVAAAQEERFSRIKNDAAFPIQAIEYCLLEGNIDINQVDHIVFYDKPLLKFERLLETYYAFAPAGLISFFQSMPVWLKEKLFLKRIIRKELKKLGAHEPKKIKILFPEHHLSHAASAFYPSPFEEAAILCIDGVGEWASATIMKGKGNSIELLREMKFPHSLGLLYSAFTYYLGFKVNSGEYKMMGLAPYGNKNTLFKKAILENMIQVFDDGSIWLNQSYFRYATGLRMTKDKKWKKLLGLQRRKPETEVLQAHCDLALAIQEITEMIVLKMAQEAKRISKSDYLCLAGGVALNSVANGKLLKAGIFKEIYIQAAAGDAGGALGAALAVQYIFLEQERRLQKPDSLQGAYLGPSYEEAAILKLLEENPNASFQKFEQDADLYKETAKLLANGKVIGWMQGRLEFGPRALGNRSILGDPRNIEMQQKLNLKIKFRESFRPFAPAVLAEDVGKYFELESSSPYMLLVLPINNDKRLDLPEEYLGLDMKSKLAVKRSSLPAITHVDFSARIQSVHKETNPRFYDLLQAFKAETNCSVLINTSFNVRGEPIVCSPQDAYQCFIKTDMDYLVISNYLFQK